MAQPTIRNLYRAINPAIRGSGTTSKYWAPLRQQPQLFSHNPSLLNYSIRRHVSQHSTPAFTTKAPPGSKMRAYWYDNVEGDQRLPHDSGREVTLDQLKRVGVLYSHHPTLETVDALAESRNYKNRDQVTISPTAMGAIYEEKVKSFFSEHMHEDEEIRYIREGKGYFDVRNEGDEWIRILLEKDDLIILPAGIYHRFTTTDDDYIVAMRLFKEEPKWTPLNRGPEVDKNPYREEYVKGTIKA